MQSFVTGHDAINWLKNLNEGDTTFFMNRDLTYVKRKLPT